VRCRAGHRFDGDARLARDLVRRTRKDKTVVLLSDVQEQPRIALRRSELLEEFGEDCVFNNIDDALAAARRLLA
jgi:sulfate permease, SulP family